MHISVHISVQECVGIQTATLWIFYGHPARNKCAGFLFEFHFTITLTVLLIYRTITDPKN